MGELWRSEEMQLMQLFVQIEAAHDTVDELGKVGLVQFRDVGLNVHPLTFRSSIRM
jgi:V-type H+-transporting ATPase subunit a